MRKRAECGPQAVVCQDLISKHHRKMKDKSAGYTLNKPQCVVKGNERRSRSKTQQDNSWPVYSIPHWLEVPLFETFTFDQGLTSCEPPTPRSSPRNPFLNLSSLTERGGKKRDRLSVGKQSFVWPPKESAFGREELKMAGLLNMLVYLRKKQQQTKEAENNIKKRIKNITFLGVADTSVAILECCLFPQKATAGSPTADCKHTAHYPGVELTLHIYRKYPFHHGSVLWRNTWIDSLAQISFSLNFELFNWKKAHSPWQSQVSFGNMSIKAQLTHVTSTKLKIVLQASWPCPGSCDRQIWESPNTRRLMLLPISPVHSIQSNLTNLQNNGVSQDTGPEKTGCSHLTPSCPLGAQTEASSFRFGSYTLDPCWTRRHSGIRVSLQHSWSKKPRIFPDLAREGSPLSDAVCLFRRFKLPLFGDLPQI